MSLGATSRLRILLSNLNCCGELPHKQSRYYLLRASFCLLSVKAYSRTGYNIQKLCK
uniref:Uncharacterized protein n=1 Tax=Rhizophora mucronata TaxID=61149 RepID=A0A2P2NGJ4_RHIMU